jgi:acyl carrier protein
MLDGSPRLASERLLALVKHILGTNSIARTVSTDDQLSEAGLSSLDMVNLMLAVEAEFEITIPASDITPVNFRSISTIEALVVRISAESVDREPLAALAPRASPGV